MPSIFKSLVFLLVLACSPAEALTFKRYFAPQMTRVRVHDGDTICYAQRPYHGVKVSDCWRLYGIDTPEISYPCSKPLGVRARDNLNNFIHSGRMLASLSVQRDKYGRHLAKVRVGKKDAAQNQISSGLARPYFGVGKRSDWCKN